MYHIYLADSDTYITNKLINGEPRVSSSLGQAGTIDLYKLYSSSSMENWELTRGLIHFDLTKMKEEYQKGSFDITHPSFKCYVNLFDVYGGQPTPSNFNLTIAPLSRSFSEGFGKDVVYLLDYDVANFESSSIFDGEWNSPGASLGSSWNSFTECDYFTNADFGDGNKNLIATQNFKIGSENLLVDVTTIISATLVGLLPDSGFRISFTESEELDKNTYFVKRFATRHAYNTLLQPRLIAKFDDSILDSSANMTLNSSGSLFLYHYSNDEPTNLFSGSSQLSGQNCIGLTLKTKLSNIDYNFNFTGSQFSRGNWNQSGVYFSDILIPHNQHFENHINVSGSIVFTPVWHSLDGTINYATGSFVKVSKSSTYSSPIIKKKFVVSVSGIPDQLERYEKALARVNIFDITDPLLKTTKFAINRPGKVINKCFYSIREANTQDVVVPFDEINNSTRVSSDENGMYFYLDGTSLLPNRSYIIDIKTVTGNDHTIYKNSSTIFKIAEVIV